MDPIAKALTVVFLFATMLSIGLKAAPADLLSALRRRGLMVRSLVANFLIIPVLGLVMVKATAMSTDVAVGLLLLAAAPGGLNAIQFTSKTSSGLSYAAALLFVLSFLSMLLSPVIASLMLPAGTPLTLPYGRIIAVLLLCVLLPLLAGLGVRRAWPRGAQALAKPMALCGTLAFVVVVVLLMAWRKQAMSQLKAAEVAAMLGFILASMVVGYLLGGPGKDTRTILATATSMRNAALGLVIAVNSFPGTNVDVAVIAFSALMIPPNMLFTVYHLMRNRRKARHRMPAGE